MISGVNAGFYRSKKDVDRIVQDQLSKLANEHEKKQKGLSFARMYFKISEFELAKQHVTTYLTVNENSPEGHRVLGHCYNKLGNKEKAISEFLKSLATTPNQPELLLLCTELMAEPSVKIKEADAKKICKLTEALYPYHPTVNQLRERLLTSSGNCDVSKVENFLISEISARPDDINLRIKQLKLFESSGRLSEAYNHVVSIENSSKFQKDNIDWYKTASEICESYENSNQVSWEFYVKVLPIYERDASLLVSDLKPNKQISESDSYKSLYRLDQALYKAIQLPSTQTEFYRSLICHLSNQLYFHLGSLILKTGKKENILSWHKTNQLAAPLFLMSLAPTIDKQAFDNISLKEFNEEQKTNVALWELEGTRRIIESGFVLRSMIANEGDHFINNVKILCNNDWKLNTYKKMFNSTNVSLSLSSSYFIHYSAETLLYTIPELIQYAVPKHMIAFEMSRPGSLHHLVWYGLQLLENETKGSGLRFSKDTVLPIGFGCKGFNDLPLVSNSFASVNVETVCQIDMNTFLYATVFTIASVLDNQFQKRDSKSTQTFPSDITDLLTTTQQENWWRSMYKIYSKNVDVKHSSQLKNAVSQGLGAIRLIGNHGIDVQLIIQLAKNFASQANKVMDNSLFKEALEKRATHFWKFAVQLLGRLVHHGIEQRPKNSLFDFYRKTLTNDDINELLDEGRFYLACQMMNKGQNEEAIEAFKKLNTPYASFYQAMIYKKMAKSEIEASSDITLSGSMISTANVLLTKVKDLLNLTKERLKKTPQHPLHYQVKEELLQLQLETDLNGTHSKDYNLDSGEEYVDSVSTPHRKSYNKFGDSSFHNTTSTPVKSPHNSIVNSASCRKLADDEPVMRVLNELKIAVQSQNVQCQTMGLQYYTMIENMRSMSERVDKLFDQLSNTKDSILNKVNDLSQNITSNPIIDPKLIDRINQLEDNFTEKIDALNEIINMRQAMGTLNEDEESTTSTQCPYRHLHNQKEGQFNEHEEGQYNEHEEGQYHEHEEDHSHENEEPMYHMIHVPDQYPQGSFEYMQELFNQCNKQMFFPFPNPNVNITNSDTLPTGPHISQPPLSVTIPTHHLLSGNNMPSESQSHQPFKFNSQPTTVQSCSTHEAPPPNWLAKTSESTPPPVFQPALSTFKESLDSSLNKSKNSATDDSYVEEHDPMPEFQPIIPLPDKIEEVTGEENDTVLFERRAKLYKYTDKEWKEKGVGLLKILRNNITAKVRLVMRREQVYKVCANHFLYENMELKPKNDKSVVWTANDFSDAVQVQIENLCARFKSVEDCEEFTKVFNENKQPCSQNNSLVEDSNCSDNDNSTVEAQLNLGTSGLSLTLENEKSLKHTLGGFTFSTPPIVNEIVAPKEPEKTPDRCKGLFSSLNLSTSFNSTFETPTLTSLLSKPTFSTVEAKAAESVEKANFSFGLPKLGNSNQNTPNEKSFFSNPKVTGENKFTMNTPKLSFETSTTKQNTPNEKPLFSNSKADDNKLAAFTPKLDLTSSTSATSYFSTLAKSSPSIGFNNSPDFKGFPGAGSTVFGSKTNPSPNAIVQPSLDTTTGSNSTPNGDGDDFVPTAEFTPVIPLPSKVEVVTGEEGLKVVFEDRAKLLRFDSNTKEWKEKGIGQMKILHNPEHGYYQLLMRRELIHKICCNQRLTTDLELKPVSSSDKAMSWIGQDFSEGQSKKELFAIRFKTVQQLQAFRDKFNDLKNTIQDDTSISSSGKPDLCEQPREETNASLDADDNKTLPKLSDLSQFKPKPGSWNCNVCYLSNDANAVKCLACNQTKPGAILEKTNGNVDTDNNKTLPKLSDLSQFKPKPGSWNCQGCYLSNDANTVKCPACNTIKPGAVVEETTVSKPSFGGFSFGKPSFASTFKFGMPTSDNVKSPATSFAPKFETSEPLSFGSLSTSSNVFVNKTDQSKPQSWREESAGLVKYDSDKSENESYEEDSGDNESDDYDGQKSVVEAEKQQFKLSNVKLELPLFKVDNLPGTKEIISEKSASGDSSQNSDKEDSVKILQIKNLKEVIPLDDQVVAENLQLPLAFFLYKSKPKCKGCVGCEDSEEGESEEHEITSSKTYEKEKENFKVQEETPIKVSEVSDPLVTSTNSFSQPFNPSKSFSFGDKNMTSAISNSTTPNVFGSTSTSFFGNTVPNASFFGSKPLFGNIASSSIKSDENKSTGSMFNLPSTTVLNNSIFNTQSPTSIFNTQPTTGSLFSKTDNVESKPESGFSFAPKIDSTLSKADDAKSKPESVFPFSPKIENTLSFASIVQNSKSNFGQSLFGNKEVQAPKVNPPWAENNVSLNKSVNEDKNSEREENGEEEVDNSHDPHFEPIVPLPEAIEVSTGEENETILFCERSKLFRKDGSEYKERGIGEMKILYHPERNTYRLLFRREKVFKVVCNHLVSSDIMLVPMKSSNKAYCWACMNCTEENPEPQKELLAIRFKNEELAEKFKEVYDDCVSKLEDTQ